MKALNYVIALVLGLGCFAYSSCLLIRGYISGTQFVFLSALASFAALVVAFRKEIDVLAIANLKVKFHEIKEAEQNVKELAAAVLELAESDEDGYKRQNWDEERYNVAKERVRNLVH